MWNLGNYFAGKTKLIIIALILAIILTYQIIITIFVPIRINVFIALIELLAFFYVLWRIIWCN